MQNNVRVHLTGIKQIDIYSGTLTVRIGITRV